MGSGPAIGSGGERAPAPVTGDVSGRLERELARARADLAYLRAEFADLADPDVQSLDDEHDAEGATIGFERARVAGLIERTESRMADLAAAAGRVASGSYATCRRCGGPIGAERLAALPTTDRCVACAAITTARRGTH